MEPRVAIRQPENYQVVFVGSELLVEGEAEGRRGTEPSIIRSVTVQLDNEPEVQAVLELRPGGGFSFTATLRPSSVGERKITANATTFNNEAVTDTVTVRAALRNIITSYRLVVHDKQRRFNFKGLGVRHPDAQILVWTQDGRLFRIYFLPDNEDLVRHYKVHDRNEVVLFLHSRQYAWCVDVLRNEGPQYINWEKDNFTLGTFREAPGEGDD